MLSEFHGVTQERNAATRRRWFQDEGMDLIVWYDSAAGDAAIGFQLCYCGVDGGERALTWRRGFGFSHARVDSGDQRPDKNLSPVLIADGDIPWTRIEADFAARAGKLEPDVRELVTSAWRGR